MAAIATIAAIAVVIIVDSSGSVVDIGIPESR
jgi:hypothetical protein